MNRDNDKEQDRSQGEGVISKIVWVNVWVNGK